MEPTAIDLRAYNVGFGDGMLLSFEYPAPIDGRNVRHVLIDFGTKALPKGVGKSDTWMQDMARRIAADCGGKLDAVVVTHRHQDHLSGFAPNVGGEILCRLQPDRVLRPWTEEPGVTDADHRAPGEAQAASGLAAGQELAGAIAGLKYPDHPTELEIQLRELAELQVHNEPSMRMLAEMSVGQRGRYLRRGDNTDTDALLPGVRITVLGPPDPSEAPDLYRYADASPEYWLRLAQHLPASVQASMRGEAAPGDAATGAGSPPPPALPPGPTRWLVDRLERQHVRSAFALVQAFDDVLNNTSLVLLIEAAGHTMLFAGDAQLENWNVCLNTASDPAYVADVHDRLRRVDLFKVGHHGSRNATPKKSLFPLLAQNTQGSPLAVLSTLSGVFKDVHPVPAQALVDKLSAPPFRLVSTNVVGAPTRKVVHVRASGAAPFAEVQP